MAVPLPVRRNSPEPGNAEPDPDVTATVNGEPVTIEAVRAELLNELRGSAASGRLPPRMEFGPPRLVEPAVPFVQRYNYEVVLARDRERFDAGWSEWAYLGDIFPTREWWAEGNALSYLAKISALQLDLDNPVESSLLTKWERLSPTISDEYKPLRMMELADAAATKMNLTIRRGRERLKLLTADKMNFRVDPTRGIEAPEDVGVLQLASVFADAARRQKDTFFVVDIWKYAHIPQFGGGKTVLLFQILSETARMLGSPFDLRWDVVYADDYARLQRFLGDRTNLVCRGIDEMDQFLYKRSSQSGDQKAVIAVLKRNRKWGQIWGGCTPLLWELDEFMREIKVTHRVRIRDWNDETRTGEAEVYSRGGDKDEKSDVWGGYEPMMSFGFGTVPTGAYEGYRELVAYVEDNQRGARKSALDAYLSKNRNWLADRFGVAQVPDDGEDDDDEESEDDDSDNDEGDGPEDEPEGPTT